MQKIEIVKKETLTKKQLTNLLKDTINQLKQGKPVKSETLNAEVNPEEPINVKLRYSDNFARQMIQITISLVGSGTYGVH
jgi:hypothetical protein